MSLIEINYLAPVSKYQYNIPLTINKLVLLSKTTQGFATMVWDIIIPKLGNVTESIRGYPVAKTIQVPESLDKYIQVKLFQFNRSTNILSLLVSGSIDTYDTNSKIKTILYNPPQILGQTRTIKVFGGLSTRHYLMEPFHNFNHNLLDKAGVLVSRNITSTRTELLKGNLYFPKEKEVYLINRYSPTNMIEYVPEKFGHLTPHNGNGECDINCILKYYYFHIKYINKISYKYKNKVHLIQHFLKDFKINITDYSFDSKNWKTFEDIVARKIDPLNRPVYLDEDRKNNIILSPIDSRIKMFQTKDYLTVLRSLFNLSLIMPRNGEENRNLIRGSGFISRIMPQDNRELYTPYNGEVTKIFNNYNTKTNINIMAFKIENDYFMAPHVLERDQFSVVYGKCLHFNRGCSERLDPQQDTKLQLYMIVIGSGKSQPVVIQNNNIQNYVNKNSLTKSKIWLNKGDKLGYLDLSSSFVVVLSNRGIDFTTTLSHSVNKKLPKYREHLIKSNDLVGYIL